MATVDSEGAAPAPSLWAEWRHALVGVAGSTLSLALAEGRLAMLSGAAMIMLALWSAALAFTAWLLLAIAAADAIRSSGVPLWAACLMLAVLHVLAALVCWRYTLRLSRHLVFPVTRRVVAQSLSVSRVTSTAVADSSQLEPAPAQGVPR